MQIRIVGGANLSQAKAEFAALERQVAALNAEMRAATVIPGKVNPAGYAAMNSALNQSSRMYRNAMASSGLFRVEQLRLNSATEHYTELLQKQKLSFKDLRRNQAVMKAVYKEQLALQNMVVRQSPGSTINGRGMYDIAVPTQVSKELDTINKRLGFARAQIASGSQMMVNWGKNTQWAGRQLMVGITLPIAAFGAVTGVLAYNVDKNLTRVAKVYNTTADSNNKSLEGQMAVEKELAQVRSDGVETATRAAKQYGAAVADTLDVQADLAATGKKGQELQDSTTQVMRIATLGEFDHATALKTVIALQSIMGDSSAKLAQDLDYMNAIENATSLATEDFAKAIPIALGPMKQMGGNLQDLAQLLVAMKERGIQAGEGANAIKAMMQRLYRPSKQIREEWEKLTNTDILQIRDKNKGSIMGMLADIQKATDGLNRAEKVQAIGGLIGTYQVSRVNAILGGFKDITEGVGQSTEVLKVNAAGWQEWGNIANTELDRWQESASGKFKIALETMKAELAKMGEPFLEMGAKIVTFFAKAASWFNGLPDWIKKGAAFAAIFAALVGPIVMLIGLTANFAGNMGKLGASILGLASDFNVLNKGEQAQILASKLVEAGFVNDAKAAQMLTAEIKALNLAFAATRPQIPGSLAAMGAGGAAARQQSNAQFIGMPAGIGTASGVRHPETGLFMGSQAQREQNAQIRAGQQEQHRLNMQQQAGETISRRTSGFISSGAASTALMAGSMVGMMATSNETAHNIAKWAMISALVLPAIGPIVNGMKAMAAAAAEAAAATALQARNAAAAAVANGASTARMAGAMGAMRGVGAGLLAGIGGPITLAIAAAGTLGFILYKMHKAHEKYIADQIAQQKALNNSTQAWADNLGTVAIQYKRINAIQIGDTGKTKRTPQDMAADLKKSDPDLVSGFADASQAEKATIALQQYIVLMRQTGATAAQARDGVQALFLAAGEGAVDAQDDAQNLYMTLGSIDSDDLTTLWGRQINDALAGLPEEVDVRAQGIGITIGDAIARSSTASGKNGILTSFGQQLTTQWQGVFNDLSGTLSAGFDVLGVRTGADLSKLIDGLNAEYAKGGNSTTFAQSLGLDPKNLSIAELTIGRISQEMANTGSTTSRLGDIEASVTKELATQLGITTKITSLSQLKNTLEYKAATASAMSTKQAMATYRAYVKQQNAVMAIALARFGFGKDVTNINQEQQLSVLNTFRLARGLQQTTVLADGLSNRVDGIAPSLDKAAGSAHRLGSAMMDAFNNADWQGAAKTIMTGVQGDLGNAMSAQFDANMQASIASAQKSWDARVQGLQNAQQRQQDAFDARWDRKKSGVEKYYDARLEGIDNQIKAEQKAEEIRQRIFEAEKTRIERLNDMQNRNIDFNVAINSGQLDEAAKIRNDAEAQAIDNALTDAADKGSRKSQSKIDKLGELKDDLTKEREARLKAMDKKEADERRHLEKVQKMREQALQNEMDASMAAQQKIWDNRKVNMDNAIAYFNSYVATNEADLKKHIARVSAKYSEFGQIMQQKADGWGMVINNSLVQHTREATNEIKSDAMWTTVGKTAAQKMIMGALGMTMSQFRNWMISGKWPSKTRNPENIGAGSDPSANAPHMDPGHRLSARHTGGFVDSSRGSRKGVARTAPITRMEQLMLLQKGEFVSDRQTSAKYGPLLQDMNSGRFDSRIAKFLYNPRTPEGLGGPGPKGPIGMAGYLMAMVGNAGKAAIGTGITVNHNRQVADWRRNQKKSQTTGPKGGILPPMSGSANSIGKRAIEWAMSMLGESGWTYLCQKFVRTALGAGAGFPTAESAWYGAKYKHSIGDPTKVPAGVPVYWTNGGAGHVALSSGGGGVVSTDFPNMGLIGRGTIAGITSAWGQHLAGWTEDINGKRIFGLPGMRTGGFTMDDGLAMLHKDEAVTTKPLTRDLIDGARAFANGAGSTYNVNMNIDGGNLDENKLVKLTVRALRHAEDRKPKSRRG